MKKFIVTIRQYATALKMLRTLPLMKADIYRLMNESKQHSDEINNIEEDIKSLENSVSENENSIYDNRSEINDVQSDLEEKISSYDVIDIVEDERDYICSEDIGDYTLDADSIRQLVQEELEEYAPAVSEDMPMISPEEYQNIINDVVREIVQRLEA
jgi:chromosome segregation ATPase